MNVNMRRKISKSEINELPLVKFQGSIWLVPDCTATKACSELLKTSIVSGRSIVGFDTESRPSFKKGEHHPIALIQLSTSRLSCLFRVSLKRKFPISLRSVLENEEVTKIGQGSSDEIKEIRELWGVKVRGLLDLIPLARHAGCDSFSLRSLAALYLSIRISKSAQTSNWQNKVLTKHQQGYAATDALVCREIFLRMKNV